MAELASRETLQPALLDRLTDENPDDDKPESRESRVITRSGLRKAVLRDLAWLLNATRSTALDELAGLPYVQGSVINFGLPPLAGETASSLDVIHLEESIRAAIQAYEPRISGVQVQAVLSETQLDHHNVVSIEIRGNLWGHPVAIELLLRTDVDLETGEVHIRDLGTPGVR